MSRPTYLRGPLTAVITNLYDLSLAQRGLLEGEFRSVGILGAVVDLCVLSLGLPPVVAESLGFTAKDGDPGRLPPVELRIRDRVCHIEPFLTTGHNVVIGQAALTALGLKYDPEWGVMDDSEPTA